MPQQKLPKTKMKPSNVHKIVFLALSVTFVLDAFFLHNIIPWGKNLAESSDGEQGHSSIQRKGSPEHARATSDGDVRSRQLFPNNDHPYVPSRRASAEEKPSIPHIIHQTWDTEQVPELFHKWIVTWLKANPGWQYWFWTLDDVRRLIASEYPHFLNMYDIYTADIFRSDAMRYFVLHKYGGFYLDLDMESLKPLENWTYGFQCIVSEETYEHPFIVREQNPPANIVNGFIASRPGHAFMKLAVDSLEEFAGYYYGDFLHATGPYFLNAVLERYLSRNKSVDALENNHDDVTVVPPKYFFPTYDPSEGEIISERCFPGKYQLLNKAGEMTCEELLKTFMRRSPVAESYTDHHWVHAYMYDAEWKKRNTKSIRDIEPRAIVQHIFHNRP